MSTVACQPFCGPGSGVFQHLRGHSFIRHHHCTGFAQFMQMLYTIFVQIIDLEAHNEYTGFGESRRTEATETPRPAAVVGRRPRRRERRTSEHDLEAGE